MRKPERFSSSGFVHCLLKGAKIRPIQAIGNEPYLKKIPTDHVGIK